jgi:hypothetical protein
MGGYVMFLRMYMHSQAQEQKERRGEGLPVCYQNGEYVER